MPRKFLEGVILHIEDEMSFLRSYAKRVAKDMKFSTIVIGEPWQEMQPQQAVELMKDLVTQLGEGTEFRYLGVRTGQLARTFLADYIPSSIISDSEFPLNGCRTIDWMLKHGFRDYPLIGLSGRSVSELTPRARNFFTTTNAKYINKVQQGAHASVLDGIRFSAEYVKNNNKNYLVDPKRH